MVCEKNEELIMKKNIKFKVRFDYMGRPKSAKFFFGRKNSENIAEDMREQQVAMWRNIPIQGVKVENIDLGEIYRVYDEELEEEIAYAPMELLVMVYNVEDIVRFIVKDEFRKIEILEPNNIDLSKHQVERLLFKFNEEMKNMIFLKAKKYKE
ncbi:hypothetical protein [Candidatus Contubernalis alkaliaceticus]|uniref:hypothetical protein n=1 Tax=Candidatus Contubernalis alkaliaceticus TaxID=338645 RepID=UPI001F4C04D8|nr:hypothetical protein [Candidatus Contubernalis alkalaceticus]UNC92486.1 hypothetical protein HUE98_10485 [Candidatus Contubernalis alkalaceticus]